MEVLIPDPRGSHHLPIWSASACRTVPNPFWWHHQFMASVLATCFLLNTTSLYQYLSCYVTCQSGVFKIVQPPLLSSSPCHLKRKPCFCTNALATNPFSSTFMNGWLWFYYRFRRGFYLKSLQPEKKTLLYRPWNPNQGHQQWNLYEGLGLLMVSNSSVQHVAWEVFSPSRFE